METNQIEVTGSTGIDKGWEEVLLVPIGDIQLGATGVHLDKVKSVLDKALQHKNPLFLGMGDMVDVMSPSNRAAWKSTKLYDSTRKIVYEQAEKATEQVVNLLKGTAGKWIGMLEGHHLFEFDDGTTSDTRIAKELGATFLGTCALIRIKFRRGTSSTSCVIWAHHGCGNGVSPHAPLNKLYHMAAHFTQADIVLMGHMTKKPVVKIPDIGISDNGHLQERERVLAGTGGFMGGYTEGSRNVGGVRAEGSYVEKAMLTPAVLGCVMMHIKPVRVRKSWIDTYKLEIVVEV